MTTVVREERAAVYPSMYIPVYRAHEYFVDFFVRSIQFQGVNPNVTTSVDWILFFTFKDL